MVMTRLTSPQFIQCWQVLFRRECATVRAKKKETRRGKQVLHESENTQQREQWSGLPMWSVKTSGGKRVSFCLCQAAGHLQLKARSHINTRSVTRVGVNAKDDGEAGLWGGFEGLPALQVRVSPVPLLVMLMSPVNSWLCSSSSRRLWIKGWFMFP